LATTSFQGRLHTAARANDSWLCVGLDPDPTRLPVALAHLGVVDWLPAFLGGIVDATRDQVCCYKPNLAFFEALGMDGQIGLRAVLKTIPTEIPVLMDAKRGDMANTMDAYVRAIFDDLGADAMTVNPYLGGDALAPALAYPDRGVFVLCKTSNPGSGELQDLRLAGSEDQLFVHVARRALTWDRHGTVGLVVGATYPEDVAAVRQVASDVPILVPGVGAQSGNLERSVRAGIDVNGENAMINASRAVSYASADADWQDAARSEAIRLRMAINAARSIAATAGH
jgi:orotidine-5'-phosphate decarboxylase